MLIEFRTSDLANVRLGTQFNSAEIDDIRLILCTICECLEGYCEFAVSGFGQAAWPVDVYTDFPIFLEQLPQAIRAVSSREPTTLDFWEQGIERNLTFEPSQNGYSVSCSSYGTWQPNPTVEEIEQAALQKMLLAVRDGFLQTLQVVAPSLVSHPLFQSWLDCGGNVPTSG